MTMEELKGIVHQALVTQMKENDRLVKHVANLESQVQGLQEVMSSFETEINGLQDVVSALLKEVEELRND